MDVSEKDPGWGKRFRGVLLIVSVSALLCFGVPTAFYLLMDHKNEPLCHKAALMQVFTWIDGQHTDDLPNVEGRSVESLSKLFEHVEQEMIDKWNAKYQYVPGLRQGDSGDLVLMYMKRPTRYIWHGNPQTIFRDAMWMTVPLDFAGFNVSPSVKTVRRALPCAGENSERLSFDEFKNRLMKTLDFLRENNRPNWQTVVAENEALLNSIEK